MNSIKPLLLYTVLHFGLHFSAVSQTNKIKGNFPGKENTRLYISYFPPGLASTGNKYTDSCIIDREGKFEFISPFDEPVLAYIRFDYKDGFDFVTDAGIVELQPLYQGSLFSFPRIEAKSLQNKYFKDYKEYIIKESLIADSLYAIREKYRAEKKRDSMKFLEPTLEYADSCLFQKNFDFVKASDGSYLIKSLITYRKIMLRIPIEEVKGLYKKFDFEGQRSIYGLAINKFILDKEGLQIGDTAPSFTDQLSPKGAPVHLEDFRGKFLLIDFWAAWCAPCRAENPNTIRIYNKYKSDKFDILGISLDRRKDEWLKAIEQDKLPWMQASDLKFWDNECVKIYGIYSVPFNVLIDPEGKIIAVNLHGDDLENKLKKYLNNQLK